MIFLLAACSPEAADPPTERVLYAGEGLNRLCIAGTRAGFIIYDDDKANCTARGRVERTEEKFLLIPDGDAECRIEGRFDGQRIVLGNKTEACSYYCGPGADYAGSTLLDDASASPAVDFAGDPLC